MVHLYSLSSKSLQITYLGWPRVLWQILDSRTFDLVNIKYQQMPKSASKLLINTKFGLSYTDSPKTKLPCFSFTALVSSCLHFIQSSLILLTLIVEWFKSTLHSGNPRDAFSFLGELDYLSLLLAPWLISSDNCRMSYRVHGQLFELPCLNGPVFILTVMTIILSTLLFMIWTRLVLYASWTC